ncbi:MAG: histone deacetylase family protein [Alphaproteobacteria bacterium]|nr:histone deacetylase family protein [Alphaproteobacteria bacterium]
MQVIYSSAHEGHSPGQFVVAGCFLENPEVAERAARLLAAVRAAGHEIVAPDTFGAGPCREVHSADYLDFLAHAHALWQRVKGASAEVLPSAHPGRRMTGRPQHIIGLAGYHMADAACPIGAGTWEAAQVSCDIALTAAAKVLDGERVAYGLCRPPGHHAFSDMAGGFCFINNVAVAAEYCRKLGAERVAILDIDVHHGNGTQGIFYGRGDVLFVSVHADPSAFYPFFAGYAAERGAGAGEDANLNLPVALGAGNDAYIAAINDGCAKIRAFQPEAVLVSLGFDAYEGDPLSPLKVTSGGFEAAGKAIAALATPTVLIQEGGYDCQTLGRNLMAYLTGFLG